MAKGRKSSRAEDMKSIQNITLSTYESIKQELAEIDSQLEALQTRRENLEKLGRGLLEVNLKLGQLETAEPEPAPAPRQAKPEQKAAKKSKKSKKSKAKKSSPGKSASKPKPSPKKEAAKPSRARSKKRKRKPGKLERDVRDILDGDKAMRAKDVIDVLINDRNYKDNDSTRTYVYSSLGKWKDEDWLNRVGRGLYKLA